MDGTIGFAVTTGGEPAAYIVEKHLARFLEGRDPAEVEKIWDQMSFSTQYYGRKGLVVNALSGADLTLWDLRGKLRRAPGNIAGLRILFGVPWGFGGLTYGLTMRYLGLSLGMAVVLGLRTVFGMLIRPSSRATSPRSR